MTVTLFADTDYKGKCQSFAKNKACLKDTKVGNNPSSIKLTKDDEAVLLFKRQDWKGGCLYIRGPKNVSNLGTKSEGGKSGFKNGVTSLRRTDFTLDLNVSIVCNTRGKFPGGWTSASEAEAGVAEIVEMVNQFYTGCRALLRLKVKHCVVREDDDKFIVSRGAAKYPGSWKRSGEIDVIFVHDFKKVGTTGKGKPPVFGQTITVACMEDFTGGTKGVREPEDIARTLAHELGHFLGIQHASAKGSKTNLMYKEGQGHSVFLRTLRPDQVEEMHTTLSKNISRKGLR